nr:immunoglobulin heavy chain junction region [Macaca mulatta]MOV37777.1 immunoglobulin heavy chain junction region [Macaca mulatta]MOV37779.1 immunoglobulin heavy chain junction region [Macaca mulatta]MOV37793.1 immunoglobulin heavy chain junction region [Macaca mulatta]MOV37817.1 immunoglobulin heavy chain junction region [Macaca mulatta]
CAKKEDSLDVW